LRWAGQSHVAACDKSFDHVRAFSIVIPAERSGLSRIARAGIHMWTAPGSQEEVQQPRIGSLAIICPV